MRWLNRTIVLIGLTSLLTDVSSEMVYPLMPLFLTSVLGATPGMLGIVEGTAESLASVVKLFSGRWSDRSGRRKPWAMGGYIASVVGKALIYLASGWPMFLAGRIGDRFGKGIRGAPRDAMVAESVPHDQLGHAFGFERMMDTAGAAVGVIGAYLLYGYLSSHVGTAGSAGVFRTVFLWSLAPAVLAVAALTLVSEPRHHKAGGAKPMPKLSWRAFRGLPGNLQAFLAIAAVFTLGNSSNQFLLLRANKELGFSTGTVILMYLVYNLTYAAVSYPAGRLSDVLGRRRLLVIGYAIYGLVYLGFAVLTPRTGVWAWGLFSLYGVYTGITDGVEKALVSQLAPKDQKATVLGLYAAIVGVGLLPASIIAGQLWDRVDPAAPFVMGGVLGLGAAGALWWRLRGV